MKIIVDADACPNIKEIHELCVKNDIRLILVSDYHHNYDMEGIDHIKVVSGENTADYKIISIVEPCDIVITQDYALASILLAKNACVIDPYGREYTDENISSLLATRHMFREAVRRGDRIKGGKRKKRKSSDNEKLLNTIINKIKINKNK